MTNSHATDWSTGDPPIFVVGVARSGTTLLAAMLCAHSRLSCGPETHFFRHLRRADPKLLCATRRWPHEGSEFLCSICSYSGRVVEKYGISREQITSYLQSRRPSVPALLGALTEQYMLNAGKQRWVEKTPSHIADVARIRKYFPRSPIVRIVRDPRDVALSLVKMPWGPRCFDEAIGFWRSYDDEGSRFFQTDENSYTLRYEDLLLSPERELQRLCRFLGERFERGMLDTSASVRQINRTNVSWIAKAGQPLDVSRIGAWKTELAGEQIRLAEFLVGSRLEAYGYSNTHRRAICIRPLRALLQHRELLGALASHPRKLWYTNDPRRCDLALYVGHPDADRWLGSRRWRRAAAITSIAADVLGYKMKGTPVQWIAPRERRPDQGASERALSLVLGRLFDLRVQSAPVLR